MSSALITPIAAGTAQVRALSVFFRWQPEINLTAELLKVLVDSAANHSRRLLVVDLRGTDSLEPRLLEWLEQLSAFADARQVRLRVVSPRGSKSNRLLTLLRYDRFLVLASTVLEALRLDPRR